MKISLGSGSVVSGALDDGILITIRIGRKTAMVLIGILAQGFLVYVGALVDFIGWHVST